jgi:O-antigen/teichoic acid export membrane protein
VSERSPRTADRTHEAAPDDPSAVPVGSADAATEASEDDPVLGSGSAQLRGSSLLFLGKFLAIGGNLLIQVLIVRYLSQSAYGAFAYALAIANLLTVVVGFGLDQAIQRFAAIYDERKAFDRLAGAIVLQIGLVLLLGTIVSVATWASQDLLLGVAIDDPRAVSLLAVMVLLAPLQALDALIMNLFAVWAKPKVIFTRKYLLAPGLKVTAAIGVVLLGGDVFTLAWAYVGATALGILVYARLLVRTFRQQRILERGRRLVFPIRELGGYAVLAVASDLVVVLLFASDAILVGALRGSEDVALVQAVQPIANGNLIVFYALIPLFIPLVSRLFARGDADETASVYRRSTMWALVFSFPVLALTVAFADVTAITLFGSEYGPSGPILALFALGQYSQAACGLAGLTLKVIAELKKLAALNVVIAVANIGVNLALIPRYGALGAAIGTAASLIVLNAGRLLLLHRATGIPVLARPVVRAGTSVLALLALLWGIDRLVAPTFPVAIGVAAVASLLLFRLTRDDLEIAAVFPELGSVPVVRAFVR